jgi:sodium transport system permease protein
VVGAWSVLRKELREARRDRNLALQLVLVPLLLYPLLGFAALQLQMVSSGAAERKPTVVLLDADAPEAVRERLRGERTLSVAATPDSLDACCQPIADLDLDALRRGWDDPGLAPSLVVSWWTSESAASDSARLYYDRSRERSVRARATVQRALAAHADSVRAVRASDVGMDGADLLPWATRTVDRTDPGERGRWLLALALPVFLMLMLPQGTFYATLDTVVGERERGTWETVLTSPLGRGEILFGKFLYVVLWSLVAFTLNLVGLLVFVVFVLDALGIAGELEFSLAPGPLAVAFAALILLASSLAAVMMVMAAGARNYREGQAALTPVYLVAAFSGMFVMVADESFTLQQAFVPIVNVTALLRAALQGSIPVLPAQVTFVQLLLLAGLCLSIAVRVSRSEAVLFDPEFSFRRALGRLRRGSAEPEKGGSVR